MNHLEIYRHIDHTLLRPCSSWEEVKELCKEAIQYQVASVCIPPSYVRQVKNEYGELITICTVIGFPLGYHTTASKVEEARLAIEEGASEIDMVINLCDVKNGDFDSVTEEIRRMREVTTGKILKVIIETCYLTEEEKIRMCEIVTGQKADYIKTSTGFGTGGATIEDVTLFSKHIGNEVKIKAAGGVKTKEDLVMFLEAGCDRIGTSSAVKILAGEMANGY